MDKLKPILAHKFWIFFGLVLILPLVGYFMTTGELAADIEARWKGLDTTFSGIPSGVDSPNEQWINGLQALNDQKKIHIRQANEALWLAQKVKMRWPDDIAAIMNKAEYFKPVPPEQGGADIGFKYMYDYPREIRRLWEIVDPIDEGKNLRDSDKRRKIAFAMGDLYQTNTARWVDLPPTFPDIWACQEDIWLQTELLQAIARVNANAISQGDAFVKQLNKILLFGGTKATGDAAGGAPAPGGTSSAPIAGSPDGNPFGGSPMGIGGRQGQTVVSVDINLSEEFTLSSDPNALSGGGGTGGAGGFGSNTNNPMYATDGSAGGLPGSPAGGAAAGKPESKRYIDEDENQPYKRRGFYIKVIMDHTKIPDLIAELMNSPFPVEIVRVQQVQLSDSATSPGGGSPSPFMAASGSGGQYPVAGGDAPMPLGDDGSAGGFPAPTAGSSSRPGGSSAGSQAAMSDPNLAHVAILGVWTLYRPPAPAPDAGQPATPGTAAPLPDVAGTPPAAAQPAETTAETKPAATETTGDEPQKPSDSEAPKADAATPEKKEPDSGTDKPAEKSPAPPESTEKPASEPKP